MQIVDEFRRADQIVDAQPDIDRPPQPQKPCGLAVEPHDLVLAREDDDAIRQGRPVYEQLEDAVLVPALNALLNGLCTVALLAGFYSIRLRKIPAHRAAMAGFPTNP